MSQAVEFILVPKKQYLQKEPLAAQVLNDPENKHPSAHLSSYTGLEAAQKMQSLEKIPLPKKQKQTRTRQNPF